MAAWTLLLAIGITACGGPDSATGPNTRPGSITVYPDSVEVPEGSSYALIVHAKDGAGNAVPLNQISWSSTDPGVATTDSLGQVLSRSPGTALVFATAAGVTDTVHVTVTAGSGTAAVTVSPGSATITVGGAATFTATARDAHGDPITDPITWSTAANSIARVDANGRVTGVATGTTTVRAGVDGLLGTATVRVTAPTSQVVSVQVTPSQTTVTAGEQVVFSAVPRDQNGNAVAGVSTAWSSANNAVATIASNGAALGRAPGDARIDATAAGVTGSATLHVNPASSGGGNWPHEPSGFTPVSDQPWTVADALDWVTQFGSVSIGLDLTAPLSPPSVLTITYPVGFVGGSAPGTMTRQIPGGHRYFFATWWKASNPWQGHETNVNKILFFFPSTGGDVTMVMYGHPGGPYELRVLPQFDGIASDWLFPNIDNVPVTLGDWHRLEWLVDYGTGTGTGTIRWWMDGQMIGSYTTVTFPTSIGTSAFKISPTWGGVGDTKTETDFFWFDETYLSYQP